MKNERCFARGAFWFLRVRQLAAQIREMAWQNYGRNRLSVQALDGRACARTRSLEPHAAKWRRSGGKSRHGIAVWRTKLFRLKHISSMRKNMSGLRQRCGEPRQNL